MTCNLKHYMGLRHPVSTENAAEMCVATYVSLYTCIYVYMYVWIYVYYIHTNI